MAMDSEGGSVGTDSFLDVITNFVGILIILVMVVGDQARHAVLPKVEPPDLTELKQAEAEALNIEGEVHRIAAQMKAVDTELAARTYERDQVLTVLTAVDQDLAARRASLDEADRAQYDLERDLALANDELKKLKEERDLAETTDAPETITVKSYPSPLGKSVSGPQISFRLLAGRIAYLPWDELFGRMKASAQDRMRSAPTSSEVTDTLGPIQGFRMRYVMQRIDTAQGTMMRMLLSELLPVSERLGEPLDLALKQGSEFQAKMAMVSPDRYTVTVWVYPDSFGEFRRLKELLYERGYEVAGFPIEPGQTIGASPYGFKSIAQ